MYFDRKLCDACICRGADCFHPGGCYFENTINSMTNEFKKQITEWLTLEMQRCSCKHRTWSAMENKR